MENYEQNTEQQTVEDLLSQAAENAILQDEEEQKENMVKIGKRWHESHTDRRTVRSFLKKYQEKKIILPLCQRLYVWNEKARTELLDSVERGLLCGSIELATREGNDEIQYLCDGLQRMTSLLLLSNDPSLTEEQRKKVLDYQLTSECVYDLNDDEMALWFLRLNSGITVASATKERAKLPEAVRNEVIKLSGSEFFRNIADKANATFSKNSHSDIITYNALLAAAGIEMGDNKAKALCSRLTEHEADITANTEKAEQLIERVEQIYNSLADDQIKRSMNANFVSVLVYVIQNNNFTNEQYNDMINHIFENSRAVKEYSETTRNGAGDADKLKKRYDVIVNILKGNA
jgi:uncharacterized protein with ParB-like and HNH nuclease domain